MSFDTPLLLWIAPALGVVIAGLGWWARSARVARARRWSGDLATRAAQLGKLSPLALGITGLAAAIALSGPRWGTRVVITDTKGLNLVIAVDVSRSMLAEDVSPSRLERAKRQARRLVQDLAGDRIGLVAFAGQSFVLSPLTVDGSALQLLIDAMDPSITSAGGTALAPVLTQGRDLLFAGDEVADRVLVVFTDGEAHDTLDAIFDAATRLHRDGVRLVLVGEGLPDPARIPVRDASGTLRGFQRDPSNSIVETARRDDILNSVQDAAHGVQVAAVLRDQAGAVRDLVTGYKRARQATTAAADDVSRAWIPLLGALIVLLAHTVTRRSMALAALLLSVGVTRDGVAQEPRDLAGEAWRAGELGRAAELYLQWARDGIGWDTTWYNLGTVALALGDTAVARPALERAATSIEPDVRFRALFNLGVLQLHLAEQDSARAAEHYESARRVYREALLLKPGDLPAKWNHELAVRHTPPPPESGGAPPAGGTGPDQPTEPPPSGLSRAQAEQILNSMAEEERRTRRDLLRRQRELRETRGRRDW